MKKAIWCCLLFLSMSSFIHTLVAIKTTAGAEHPAQPIALIKEVKVQGNRIDISIEDAFKAVYLKTDFFAEYDPEVDLSSLDYSIVTLPFILNVLPIVWISGKHYTIDVMDETLYHALEKIREVFRRLYPHTAWDGILQPTSLVNNSGRFHYKKSSRT